MPSFQAVIYFLLIMDRRQRPPGACSLPRRSSSGPAKGFLQIRSTENSERHASEATRIRGCRKAHDGNNSVFQEEKCTRNLEKASPARPHRRWPDEEVRAATHGHRTGDAERGDSFGTPEKTFDESARLAARTVRERRRRLRGRYEQSSPTARASNRRSYAAPDRFVAIRQRMGRRAHARARRRARAARHARWIYAARRCRPLCVVKDNTRRRSMDFVDELRGFTPVGTREIGAAEAASS